MPFNRSFRQPIAALAFLALSSGAQAQSLPVGTEITADSLEYLDDRKMMIGTGNVVVQQTGDTLSADYMTLNTVSQDLYARGNVVFRGVDRVWQGAELKYNLKTKEGDFGEFKAYVAPYYISAKESKRVSTNKYELKRRHHHDLPRRRSRVYGARAGGQPDRRHETSGPGRSLLLWLGPLLLPADHGS